MSKFLIIGFVIIVVILGSIVFLLRSTLLSEVTEVVTPYGGCLEKFDILRDTGFATYGDSRRMSQYEFDVWSQFTQDNCQYYVFRWMPEGYPERNYVEKAWYHEFRTDLTEEQKQVLRDNGHWPG